MRQWAVSLMFTGTLLVNQALATAEGTDETAIESAYKTWVEAANARDIDAWSAYLAPNAFFVPPGNPSLTTREAIVDYYLKAFSDPNFSLDCRQLSVEVAQAGEMAWAHGNCRATFTGSSGQQEDGTSRWFKVWYKQPDGAWKCGVNTWNYEGA